ncbi:MAG: hypothetical protein VYB44_07210 [Bacteroidota bacterium]|nr:hypothetical protein [Bacteroidota bacterium]
MKLTLSEAIRSCKNGKKVKLPEWGPEHYLFSDGNTLYEKWGDSERPVYSIYNSHPWFPRKDWQEVD